MSQRNVLILERSSQNLHKINKEGKVELEGVFAEFGIENRNGRIYEEKEYLPHLEYLKKDIANGNLLGELDHPERFEVALGSVSHRVSELWYDQSARQIKGRIEILNTPKGQIAKSLLEAGVPLSISSRAAGTVNEDKTVQIQQIYTYDLVAKPGFESAQLTTVNEGVRARIEKQIRSLNEAYGKTESDNISQSEFGIVNENITIVDLTDKFPSIKLREEAIALQNPNAKNKSEFNKMENQKVNEDALQQWTVFFKNELSKITTKLGAVEIAILEGKGGSVNEEIEVLKKYVKNLKSIQEKALDWQGDIAKAVNKVASYADSLAEKNNQHYGLTKRVVETVDYNAKTLNATQDWVGNNAKVTNAIGETVDHNAEMLNGVNEWNGQISRAVNALHEWGGEKAKAINGIHDWTSSIAKNVNEMANWSEDMFGRAVSKEDAKTLIKYIELVSEGNQDPELKKKLDETLSTHGITAKPLSESMITGIKGVKGLGVITDVTTTGNSKVDTDAGKDNAVQFDGKIIVAKMKTAKAVGKSGSQPKGLKTIEDVKEEPGKITGTKVKGILVLDTTKSGTKPSVKITGDGPTSKHIKDQDLKLNTKPEGKLKEEKVISILPKPELKTRASKLDEKLSLIINNIEKEKKLVEDTKAVHPFISILGEEDKKGFSLLSDSDKQKVAAEVAKNPTTDSKVIKGLWESALRPIQVSEPLWLKVAPKEYREAFNKAPEVVKESIRARSEFYPLETQYQINNFWETSKIAQKPVLSLNEVFTATGKDGKETEAKMDDFVAGVGEMMKRYQR